MKKAFFYEELEDKKARCNTCPRRCILEDGEIGFCGIRKNLRGKINLLTYGLPVSSSVDPIEKKPFFHFAPGTDVYSIATMGCNLRCKFCQNYSISYGWSEIEGINLSPEKVVKNAEDTGSKGIAYTYTEPTVFLEYCLDTVKKTGEKTFNLFVSNGYMTKEVAERVGENIDGINIDLKGGKEFYGDLCDVHDDSPIYDALKILKRKGVFIEITMLIIPGFNDSEEEIRERVEWVKENLGRETPIHFSRFTPRHKMSDVPPTPVETLEKAMDIADKTGMLYVYCGNIPGHQREHTYCPECGKEVIKRRGMRVVEIKLNNYGGCNNCGCEINIGGKDYMDL